MRITINLSGSELSRYERLKKNSIMLTMPDSITAKVFLNLGMEKYERVEPTPLFPDLKPVEKPLTPGFVAKAVKARKK